MSRPYHAPTVSGSNVATAQERLVSDQTPGLGAADPMGMIGREILGQYRVQSILGRGGMGTVFLAQQLGMNRRVAIKVLRPEVGTDPDAVRRFHIEAQAAARLASPNIVSVFNFGQLDTGELYLAMEHLEGTNLHAELVTHGRMPLMRAVDLIAQLGRGLDEAHRNGVVHRDLKPGNIMLVPRADGEVAKLLDFGIAKLDAGGHTQTEGWVGTPRYMAPEQFTGGTVDARTDVYALGLIAYEMLCGRTPFLCENPMSYVHSHVYTPAPRMHAVAPGVVPPAIEAVVLAALSKAPRDRPASAGAFAQQLAGALYAPAKRAMPRKTSPVVALVAAAVLGIGVLGGGGAYAYQRYNQAPMAGEVESHAEGPAAVRPAVAHIPTGAAEDFDPEYLSALPPRFRSLVDLDEADLLERLEASFALYPPSMREQVDSQYTLQLASMPGPGNAVARKVMLINAIVGMEGAQHQLIDDARSTDALVEDYLTRPGPIPVATRREIIESMRENVPAAEDRDWTVRQWLLGLEAHEKKQAQASADTK